MPVTLTLTFPAGRYHATPWGRHVNEGVAEWPPSPWRLLRALIATWKRKCPELSDDLVRRVLEQLVHAPTFQLPPARVAHTRHAMPMNLLAKNQQPSREQRKKKYQGDPSIIFDTFVAVRRQDPLIVHWPDATLSSDERGALILLAENLATLGRAEGWVHAELSDSHATDWNCVPSADAGTEQELVSVFCPDPNTAFSSDSYPPPLSAATLRKGPKPAERLFDCPRWHLCLDTETIHAERWPRVPGARWVSYARRADAFTRTVAPLSREPSRRREPTVARFLLDGPVLPLVTETVRMGEAFRAAAMSRFDAWCRIQPPAHVHRFLRSDQPDRYSSPLLSGKEASGQYLAGHRHAYYLATDDDRDGHLDHLTVYAADGLGAGEVSALQRLQKLNVGEGEPLRVLLVGLGQPQDFTAPLLRPSACWVSETPFLATRHVKRRGRRKDPPQLWHAGRSPEFARLVLEEELSRLRQRRPEMPLVVSIDLLDGNRMSALELPPLPFRRVRGKAEDDGGHRAAGAFRVVFSSPVAGPICLGHSSHFGLGLFLPQPTPHDH